MPALPDSIEIRLPKKAIAGNVVEIRWSDGHVSCHTSFNLRMRCPCATCRDSHNADPKAIRGSGATDGPEAAQAWKPVRGPKGVPPMVEVTQFDWVGNYAVNFIFNDGHNTGIYTYKFMREIDESANEV